MPSDRNGVELTWPFDDVLDAVLGVVVAVILVGVCTIVVDFVGSGLASSSHQMHFFNEKSTFGYIFSS